MPKLGVYLAVSGVDTLDHRSPAFRLGHRLNMRHIIVAVSGLIDDRTLGQNQPDSVFCPTPVINGHIVGSQMSGRGKPSRHRRHDDAGIHAT